MKNNPAQTEPNVPVTRGHSMGFVILISCAAGLGGLLYGYDTAVISGAIGFLKDLYRLTPFMEGLVISSIMIGGVFGAGISGFLSDRFGRKNLDDRGSSIRHFRRGFSNFPRCFYINYCAGDRRLGYRHGFLAVRNLYYGSRSAGDTWQFVFSVPAFYDPRHLGNVFY